MRHNNNQEWNRENNWNVKLNRQNGAKPTGPVEKEYQKKSTINSSRCEWTLNRNIEGGGEHRKIEEISKETSLQDNNN